MIAFVCLFFLKTGYAQSSKDSTVLMCEVDVRVTQNWERAVHKGNQKVQIDIKPYEFEESMQFVSVRGSHDIRFNIYVPVAKISLNENGKKSDGTNEYLVLGNDSTAEQFVFFESDRGLSDYLSKKITTPKLKSLSKIEIDRRTGLVEGHVTHHWPSSEYVSFKGYCKPTEAAQLF